MDLMIVEKGNLRILDFENPKIQREIFFEKWLKPGEYYMVPKSTGFNLLKKTNYNYYTNYSRENPIFISVIKDIFRKFDITKDDRLSYKELKLFYDLIDQRFDENDFRKICLK